MRKLVRESNVQKMHIANSDRPVQFYSLEEKEIMVNLVMNLLTM